MTYLTYVLSFPVEHKPQTTRFSISVLSCRLHLPEARRPHFLFQIPFALFLCGLVVCMHYSACLAMLSSLLLLVCPSPSQFHLVLFNCSCTGSLPLFFHNLLLDRLCREIQYKCHILKLIFHLLTFNICSVNCNFIHAASPDINHVMHL